MGFITANLISSVLISTIRSLIDFRSLFFLFLLRVQFLFVVWFLSFSLSLHFFPLPPTLLLLWLGWHLFFECNNVDVYYITWSVSVSMILFRFSFGKKIIIFANTRLVCVTVCVCGCVCACVCFSTLNFPSNKQRNKQKKVIIVFTGSCFSHPFFQLKSKNKQKQTKNQIKTSKWIFEKTRKKIPKKTIWLLLLSLFKKGIKNKQKQQEKNMERAWHFNPHFFLFLLYSFTLHIHRDWYHPLYTPPPFPLPPPIEQIHAVLTQILVRDLIW